MSKTCNSCGSQNVNVPYLIHESDMARLEITNKRLWITQLILIILLVVSNLCWLVYESRFEPVEEITQDVVQEADNGTNNFVGGDFTNGKAEN